MVYQYVIGAGLQIAGGYFASQAAKKAAARERARQMRENEERRANILEASENAAGSMERSANPLFAQAKGMERASKYRDPLVEQGLVSGLRQQAGAQAAQDRQTGGGDRRGAVVGQLLRGQGLLAAESQRIQRFTQMSQAAAGLRSQGAGIMGQASQARMQGAMAAANITYNGPTDTGGSDWATALGAIGGAVMAADFGGGGDTEDLSGFNNSTGPVPDVIAPDPLPLPQAATSDINNFVAPDVTSNFADPIDLSSSMAPNPSGVDFSKYGGGPPVRRSDRPTQGPHIRFDESSAPLGGPFGQEQGLGPDTRRGDGSGMFNRNEWELEKIMQPRAGQPQLPSSHKSWYKDWSNSWWR